MSRRSTIPLAILVSLIASSTAADRPVPKRGSRFYVIAVRDAGLLTWCPVFGSHVKPIGPARATRVDGRYGAGAMRSVR